MQKTSELRVLQKDRLCALFESTARRASYLLNSADVVNFRVSRPKATPLRRKDSFKAHNILTDLQRKGILPINTIRASQEKNDNDIEEARKRLLFSLLDGLLVESSNMYI